MKCESVKCEVEAVAKVYWPGRPPIKMCMKCAAHALRVGDAIGCPITVEELREETLLSPAFVAATNAYAVKTAIDAAETKFDPKAVFEKPPCGGDRCWRAEDGTWVHSGKSYGTCSEAPRGAI